MGANHLLARDRTILLHWRGSLALGEGIEVATYIERSDGRVLPSYLRSSYLPGDRNRIAETPVEVHDQREARRNGCCARGRIQGSCD